MKRGSLRIQPPLIRSHYYVRIVKSDVCDLQAEIPYWWRKSVPNRDGHQRGGQKPTETAVTEFCYKSVNCSLEELKNIKIIRFLIHELFSSGQSRPRFCVIYAEYYILTQNEMIVGSYWRKKKKQTKNPQNTTFVRVLFVSGIPIPRETGRYYDDRFTLHSGCVQIELHLHLWL